MEPNVSNTTRAILLDTHVRRSVELMGDKKLSLMMGSIPLAEVVFRGLKQLTRATATVEELQRITGVSGVGALETGLRSILWGSLRYTLHEDGTVGPARRDGTSSTFRDSKPKPIGREQRYEQEKARLAALTVEDWRKIVAQLGPSQVSTLVKLANRV